MRGTSAAGRLDRPLAVVVVSPEDHRLPAILAALATPVPVEFHVVSQCLTPLRAVERWAGRHHQTMTVHHGSLAARAGPFDLGVVADDSIVAGVAREEMRANIDALVPVVDALAPAARR